MNLIQEDVTNYLIDRLHNSLTELNYKEINISNVIPSCIKLMMILEEELSDMNGYERKDVLLYALEEFIIKTLPDEQHYEILNMVHLALPSMIDCIIAIDRRDLLISLKTRRPGLLDCFSKK